MKIVFLAPFGIRPKGTLQARMLPLARELQSRDHRLSIIAPPYTNPEDSGREEIVDGVMIRNIPIEPYHRILSTPLLAARMMMAARVDAPSLIHLFKPKGYGGVGVIPRLLISPAGERSIPILVDTDDWEGDGGMNEIHPYRSLEKRFYAFQERFILRRADGVTAASRALCSIVSTLRGDDRILHLPNGVGVMGPGDGWGVRRRYGIGADTPVVLLYTRFFEFSQDRLYRVLREIFSRRPDIRFLVVGKGRRGEEYALERDAACGGYAHSLVMAGWVDPSQIPDHIAAADLAIYPFDDTLVNRCKCPAKLTEIVAQGVAVVADRVGEIPEYLPPEADPFLTDPGAPEGMAAAVIRLIDDPPLRRRIGDTALRFIHSRFSWSHQAEMIETFYRRFTFHD